MKSPVKKNESFLSDLLARISLLKLYGNDLVGRNSSSLDDVGDGESSDESADEKSIIEDERDFIDNTNAAPCDPESSKLGFVFWVLGVFCFLPAILWLIGGNLFNSAAFAGSALFCLVVATVLDFLAKIASRLERINNKFEAVLTSVDTGTD
jgi:hypothetical protein